MMKTRAYVAAALIMCAGIAQAIAGYPKPSGWVNDYANVIQPEYRSKISALCRDIQNKTGIEFAVVTVPDMNGESIDSYAAGLFENWGIGSRKKDNGVLLLLAITERRVRIEVGYDLEHVLTDGTSGEILDMYGVPFFREQAWGRGMFNTSLAVAQRIGRYYGQTFSQQPEAPQAGTGTREKGGGIFSLIIIILLIVLTRGRIIPWLLLGSMMGGGSSRSSSGFGGFGGGFGGFGGGMSGGGGASRGF